MSSNKNNKVYKDPDVWDPPPAIEKRQPVKRPSRNISYAPQNNRNKNNQPVKGKKNGGGGEFLNARYADGNGPDANLI